MSLSTALKALVSLNGYLSTTKVSSATSFSYHIYKYLDTDDMGFGDQRKRSTIPLRLNICLHFIAGGTPDRIGGAWQLRRVSSVVINGDISNVSTLFQRDTNKGVILSTPLQFTLEKGKKNAITIRGLYNGFDYKGADIDRIVVYPPER